MVVQIQTQFGFTLHRQDTLLLPVSLWTGLVLGGRMGKWVGQEGFLGGVLGGFWAQSIAVGMHKVSNYCKT